MSRNDGKTFSWRGTRCPQCFGNRSMIRATRETTAGRRYLDLQRAAQKSKRPTDELIQLYALECFLDRLTRSRFADHFVLKGGVLLAALGARRPTRDIDLAALALDSDAQSLLTVAKEIAAMALDDGVMFDAGSASVEVIREDGQYSGARVKLSGTLSRALIRLHVDINVGDPIWPEPKLKKHNSHNMRLALGFAPADGALCGREPVSSHASVAVTSYSRTNFVTATSEKRHRIRRNHAETA